MWRRICLCVIFTRSALSSPIAQAVTAAIAPSEPIPAGCSQTYNGNFGLAVVDDIAPQTTTTAAAVTTASSSDPAQFYSLYTSTSDSLSASVSKRDGLLKRSSSSAVVPQSSAERAQASITIEIQTSGGTAPLKPQPTPAAAGVISQISDGQIQAPLTPGSAPPAAPPKARTTLTVPGVISQISDGQIQAPTGAGAVPPAPPPRPRTTSTIPGVISQISDGQIQAPTGVAAATPPAAVPPPAALSPPARVSSAAVVSAPAATVPAPKPVSTLSISVSKPSAGQNQAQTSPASASAVEANASRKAPAVYANGVEILPRPQRRAAFPQAAGSPADGSGAVMVSCATNSSLQVSLSNGVLTDSKGRIGYIASNFQFQFDGPPQAGAIYTSGFSVCSNGSLALGGSAIWYQCLSGSFYNLYDRSVAPQCNPVHISAVQLTQC